VIGDDTQAGPTVRDVDHAKMERLGETFLRPLPKTIRPFMLPGSSLYGLAKVMFAGNHIHLRQHVEVGGALLGVTPRSAVVVALPLQPRDTGRETDPQRSASGRRFAVAAVVMLMTVAAAAYWILAIDKGTSGEQAFKEAFAAWGQ